MNTNPHARHSAWDEYPRRLRNRIACSCFQGILSDVLSSSPKNAVVTAQKLLTHVNNINFRHRHAVYSVRHLKQYVPAPLCTIICCERRSRTAEDKFCTAEFDPTQRNLGSGILWSNFGVIARLMFFINYDNTQISTGANTADLAPTTTLALPKRIRRHSSKRSPSLK